MGHLLPVLVSIQWILQTLIRFYSFGGSPILIGHWCLLVLNCNRVNNLGYDVQCLPLSDLPNVLLIQIRCSRLQLLRAVLTQEHPLEVVAELAIQDEALNLIIYEVFDEKLWFGECVTELELHGYRVEMCNDLGTSVRAGHRRVIFLNLIQVLFGNIDRMRIPKIIIDHNELFLLLTFEEPVA